MDSGPPNLVDSSEILSQIRVEFLVESASGDANQLGQSQVDEADKAPLEADWFQ